MMVVLPPLLIAGDLPAGLDASAIEAACAAVRSYCGWHIAPSVTEDVVVDGSGGMVQFLPTLHLTDVQAVTNNGVAVVDPEWSAAGMMRNGGSWWTPRWRGVKATISHGYQSCPEEIVGIVASAASAGVTGQPRQAQAGSFSITPSEAQQAGSAVLSLAARAVLDRYRLPPRP